jgi:crotonobetainyl-CoA:carnitine CoA-transferase CaiB-like acyl-CoA transferase
MKSLFKLDVKRHSCKVLSLYLSATPGEIRYFAPQLGEHNEEIRKEFQLI